MDTLAELFADELKDIYNAENQLLKALPKMAKKASSQTLSAAITKHLGQTENHVKRLSSVAEELGIKLTGKKCHAMEGLIAEGKEILEEKGQSSVIDAALIGASQRIEHYEMAAYGTVRAMAETLGHRKVAKILQETLDEESAADEKLTEIAAEEVLADARGSREGAELEDAEA
jgi:ferritin-like metal-binding protein YciE